MPRSTFLFALLTGVSVTAQLCYPNTFNSTFDVATTGGAQPIAIASNCTCGGFSSGSCCTSAYIAAVKKGPQFIYNGFRYDQCGSTMSAACRRYMDAQECSYACDPAQSLNYNNLVNGVANSPSVPLCKNYCDSWFSACANDFTCNRNWAAWPQTDGAYTCGTGAPFECKTFAQHFQNGAGLCDSVSGLWGNTYSYSESSQWCVISTLAL